MPPLVTHHQPGFASSSAVFARVTCACRPAGPRGRPHCVCRHSAWPVAQLPLFVSSPPFLQMEGTRMPTAYVVRSRHAASIGVSHMSRVVPCVESCGAHSISPAKEKPATCSLPPVSGLLTCLLAHPIQAITLREGVRADERYASCACGRPRFRMNMLRSLMSTQNISFSYLCLTLFINGGVQVSHQSNTRTVLPHC